jgi:hypothetical protein
MELPNMSDGDVLKLGIPGPCAEAYRQLCSGDGTTDELACRMAISVKRFIRKYGDEMLQFIRQGAMVIESALHGQMRTNPLRFIKLEEEINYLSRTLSGNRSCMEDVQWACNSVVNDLERGTSIPNIQQELIRRSIIRIYKSKFESRVQAAPEHLYGVDKNIVLQRMKEVNPELQKHFDYFVSQIDKSISLSKKLILRLLPRPRPHVDMETEWD